MTFSRSSHFPVIFIFGASLTVGAALAQINGAAPTTPAPATSVVVEDIVARVNDQIITQSDYDRAQQQLEAEDKQQDVSPQEMDQRRKDLLRDQIDQQLLLSKGKDLGITGETELIRRLDDIRKQNHLASMEELEKAAQSQGVSYEDFKANIRNGIITQQVVQQEVGRRLSVSPEQVEAYYKAHESEFAQPESVHLSEILVATPANADAAQVATAQTSADAIEAKLQGGAQFDEVAKTSSSGPTAAQGGDLGDFRRGMLAPQLEEKTFSLKPGQFTEPIRTKQGFVILKVTEHTAGGDAGFKQAEPQVEQALYLQRMQPALRQYLSKLRDAAYIEIKPGYVDSGASANEIHPTYSAYEPPGPKKKKFARTRFRGRTHSAASQPVVASSAAVPAAPATTDKIAARGQQVAKSDPGVMKPGKKEKIRFGQAPRESLPASQKNAQAEPSAAAGETQSAAAVNPDVHYVNPQGDIGSEAPAPVEPRKTRFSSRPRVHKVKSKKNAEDADTPPPPTTAEVATQKVQDAPLGLADQSTKKKKKEKGPKTRYSANQKQPQQTPQPYMGEQSTDTSRGSAQPQTTGAQPAPQTTGGTPQ